VAEWFIPSSPVPSAPPVPMESACEPPALDKNLNQAWMKSMGISN
tara:strand:+ start:473 stop:607 length:135 start_codon:yes stop_codon:yes gene_type:complete